LTEAKEKYSPFITNFNQRFFFIKKQWYLVEWAKQCLFNFIIESNRFNYTSNFYVL